MSSTERPMTGEERPEASRVPRVPRVALVAGVIVALVGVTNVVLAVLALATDSVRLDGTASGLLLLLGAATTVLGVLVARGRRAAMVLAVVVFGGLFAVQVLGATGGAPAPALITLAVLLVPLVLALRATRPAD